MTSYDLSRRTLLRGAAGVSAALAVPTSASASAAAAPIRSPGLLRAGAPLITHGIQSGDVSGDSAVVWARADRPARMFVQLSPTGRFGRDSLLRTVRGPLLLGDTDFTGRIELTGLPSGVEVPYRVVLAAPDAARPDGDSRIGHFRTAPREHRDVRFLWSGDHSGQGWGRNPDIGGFPIFAAMTARNPDFFLHSGDSIYADGPITGDVVLPDGRVYRNVIEEAKTHVAQTLDDFRGAYMYNLGDASMQAFTAAVPMVNQWDDHEVHNNWYPEQILDDVRYTETDVDVLAARAFQSWREFFPVGSVTARRGQVFRKVSYGPLLDVFVIDMRTFRDANSPDRQPRGVGPDDGILGTAQARWLVHQLAESRAAWKLIQSDMPLGLVVPDGPVNIEAVAQGDGGPPLGRELQLAWILQQIKRRRVRNTVWLTADVHYTAAHYYDPSKAAFADFDPFWEFVSGPMHAGAFGPNTLHGTFGAQLVFQATPPRPNTSPLEGFQFFGEVEVDGDSLDLTVHLRDLTGAALHSTILKAAD
jgi:alkaline phosphatase D